MRSLKIKFNSATGEGKSDRVYYLIIRNPMIHSSKTGCNSSIYGWDSNISAFAYDRPWENEQDGNAAEVPGLSKPSTDRPTLFPFMNSLIAQLEQMDKQRTSETYRTTLNSFTRFRQGADILLDEIDADLMLLYEAYLHNRGVTRNSSSFYMRILRAVYNRAVEKELTNNRYPFRHVYTGIDKTTKRAIPLEAVKKLKALDLTDAPALDLARNMFLFSFYTRGMSFIDMAYLEKNNLKNGVLSYRRRKTGQKLCIRWEDCMQQIVGKYEPLCCDPYLLPILKTTHDNRNQYKSALFKTNKNLKTLARQIGISVPLTLYVARHTWASVAKRKNIPISIISEGMGHHSETTTQIYLASLNSTIIDEANAQILKELR